MATTAASYRTRQPAPTLVKTVHDYRAPVKFDAAFIERRMREHKAWQEEHHIETCSEDDCHSDTRAAIQTHDDDDLRPYCTAHAHVVFADWMVGV